MRSLSGVVIAIALGSSPARASVTVQPFAAPEDLAIFAPEVARAVAFGLDRAGVDVGAAGAKGEAVTGRIDQLEHERVRLKASAAGHTVLVEGSLERIDDLANDLAVRLAQALPATARRPPGTAPRLAASPPPGKLPGTVVASAAPSPVAAAAPKPAASAPAAAPIDPPAVAAAPTAPPAAATVDPPKPAPLNPPPVAAAPPEEKKTAPMDEKKTAPAADVPAPPPVLNPYPASPPSHYTPPAAGYVAPPPPPVFPPGRRWRGGGSFASGRTVLHSIGTPDGCAPGAWATFAARDVLERRLHMQTIATGACGFLSQSAAAAEARSAGVHSVVMAAFDSLRLEPSANGTRPVGRLRVIVVRDGQVVFDRTPELTGRTVAVGDLSRAAYDLVAEAFGLLAGDLGSVLNEAR